MKRNFVQLILGFVLLANQSLLSENWVQLVRNDIQVGVTPVGVIYDEATSDFNVFCAGADKNFNGQFEPDSGDVQPSWWKVYIDPTTLKITSEKKQDFPFSEIQMTNFRPAFSSEQRKIWISTFSGIKVYSLDSFSEIVSESIPINSTGLSYQNGNLYISKSMSNSKQDTVLVYNLSTKRITDKYTAGINLLQCIPFKPFEYEKDGLAFLNLGPYSSDESNIQYDSFGEAESPVFKKINIGNTGNHLVTFKNSSLKRELLLSSSMFSGKVDIIDPYNDYHKKIKTNSKEWSGPSFSNVFEIINDSNEIVSVLVTTNYNGTIEFRKLKINEILGKDSMDVVFSDEITTGFKSEGFDFAEIKNKFFLISANTLSPDYTPGNTVSLITLVRPNKINEEENTSSISEIVPLDGILHLKSISDNHFKEIRIFDLNGNLQKTEVINNEILDFRNIPCGVYGLLIVTDNGNYIRKRILKYY